MIKIMNIHLNSESGWYDDECVMVEVTNILDIIENMFLWDVKVSRRTKTRRINQNSKNLSFAIIFIIFKVYLGILRF